MTPVQPISIREHAARPHRHDSMPRVYGVKDIGIENLDGVAVEHVRNGVALTPKGALLLRQYRERVS